MRNYDGMRNDDGMKKDDGDGMRKSSGTTLQLTYVQILTNQCCSLSHMQLHKPVNAIL